VGQRRGLQVGGKDKPLFVLETNTNENLIFTGQGDDHKGLYRNCLQMNYSEVNWIRPDTKLKNNGMLDVMARIRYRQPLQEAILINTGESYYLWFRKDQRGITSGQFAAWYMDDELLGSGTIL